MQQGQLPHVHTVHYCVFWWLHQMWAADGLVQLSPQGHLHLVVVITKSIIQHCVQDIGATSSARGLGSCPPSASVADEPCMASGGRPSQGRHWQVIVSGGRSSFVGGGGRLSSGGGGKSSAVGDGRSSGNSGRKSSAEDGGRFSGGSGRGRGMSAISISFMVAPKGPPSLGYWRLWLMG